MELDRGLVNGSMALLVLKLLEDGDKYGYQMIEELERRSDDTFHLKAGTLYPLLHRLAADGLVRAEWRAGAGGPGRKFFALTDEGRALLREQGPQWTQFARNAVAVVQRGVPG